MKKGVELALNTVIVAAIALIVLIVLIVGFTSGFGDVFQKFKFWGDKAGSKSDCIIISSDATLDKDGDGYIDNKPYTVKYKNDKGEEKTLTCQCDKYPNDSGRHLDDSADINLKYC